MAICTYAEVTQAIFADCDRICSFSSSKVEIFVPLRTAVDTMKGAVSTDPEDSLMIFVNRADKGFIPVGRIAEVVTISLEWLGFRCKAFEPKTVDACPDDAFPVHRYVAYAVLIETLWIGESISVAVRTRVVPMHRDR